MNNLAILSKYRAQIMGIAIIWIMLYHYNFNTNLFLNSFIIFGYGGVDIFIFLSGYGLYYSSLKSLKIGAFYKKRAERILPIYLFSILLWGGLKGESLKTVFLEMTTLGFILPFLQIPTFDWYIPAIIILYLIFPFYIKCFQKNARLATIILFTIGIILSLIYSVLLLRDYSLNNTFILLTSRIPIFSLGVLTGKLSQTDMHVSSNALYFLAIVGLLLVGILYLFVPFNYMWNLALFWYPFILITPGLCLFLATLFSKSFGWLKRTLSFLGGISLELYLVHFNLKYYLTDLQFKLGISQNVALMILFVFSIILAYAMSKIISYNNGKKS